MMVASLPLLPSTTSSVPQLLALPLRHQSLFPLRRLSLTARRLHQLRLQKMTASRRRLVDVDVDGAATAVVTVVVSGEASVVESVAVAVSIVVESVAVAVSTVAVGASVEASVVAIVAGDLVTGEAVRAASSVDAAGGVDVVRAARLQDLRTIMNLICRLLRTTRWRQPRVTNHAPDTKSGELLDEIRTMLCEVMATACLQLKSLLLHYRPDDTLVAT